ncbi:MAG: TldD/PmbA family protein [Chloroflexi bacterium]|nr:TldD/PmbA family protein [Chloroflexota bacterium]
MSETADRILDRASRDADEVEVYFVQSQSTPVGFEANALKEVDSSESAAVAVRVIKDGRVGFSSTSDLSDIDGVVEAALETAPFGAEAAFEFPGPGDYPDVPVYDALTEGVTLEEMTALGQRVVDELRAYSNEVQVEGGVSHSTSTVALVNSRGGRFSYRRSGFRVGFGGTVIHGDDMLFTSDSASSVSPIADPSEIVASIIRQLRWAEHIATVETKTMPVILLPTAVSSVLLGPLLAGLNGKTVQQGTSPLAERLGERIVDERFSLTDDTTLPNIPGSRMSDDEGVPSRRLPLIAAGVASTFLYDLQTAGRAGTKSTGSGERGVGSLPGPGAGVLLVGEGDTSLDAMIEGTKEGLVVERLLGAGQSNVLGGDFNANVLLGYKVENGRIVGRVKNTMISGNAYTALNDLAAIGSDGRWVRGGLYAPSIALANVSVSAQASP